MLARSSWCLIRFSIVLIERSPIEGDACNPLVNDTYILTDITLSTMSSMRISSTDFSNMLCSLDIDTCNQIDRVGEQTDEVIKWMTRYRKNRMVYNRFSVSSDNHRWKKMVLA
jgi:hypothetical protein